MKKLLLAAGAVIAAIASLQPAAASPAAHIPHLAPAIHDGGAVEATNVTYGYRVSLNRVLRGLEKRGFWGFRNVKWLPYAYVVTANSSRGYPVRITVNAYNGGIIDIDRIYPRNWYGYGWR